LVEEVAKSADAEVVGSLTLVYDHHVRMLSDKLLDLQHDHHDAILSTLHVHLDHHNCLEVRLIRGPAARVHHVANALISTKGVKHGKLTVTSAEFAG
jgi:CopG family nickel-responsive transcriptional regulator